MRSIAQIFGDLSHILAVCPFDDCGHLSYLSETRPYLQGKQSKSIVDALRAEERRLQAAEEKLYELESAIREKSAQAGSRKAKRLLKKIDPVFSGAGFDPQDVKVIFDPVTYVIFDGMSAGRIRNITLLAREPESRITERVHKSIASAIKKGNLEFKTLRVDRDGAVTYR